MSIRSPVVLDPADGHTRWAWKPNQQPGTSALQSPPAATNGATATTSSTVAVPPPPIAAVWTKTSGTAALVMSGASTPELLINTANGTISRTVPIGPWELGTDADGRPLLAEVREDRLTSRAQTDSAPAIGGDLLPPGAISVERIADGHIVVSTGIGTFRLFDRSGQSLSTGIGGYVQYLDSAYLVAKSGDGDVGFEVYAIG